MTERAYPQPAGTATRTGPCRLAGHTERYVMDTASTTAPALLAARAERKFRIRSFLVARAMTYLLADMDIPCELDPPAQDKLGCWGLWVGPEHYLAVRSFYRSLGASMELVQMRGA